MHWALYAVTLFVAALIPLVAGPDDPDTEVPTASLTMTFVVMGLGTVFNALTNRRDPASGLSSPLLKALAIAIAPVTMIVLATELPGLQEGLLTTSLTGRQWLACFGLALLLPLVVGNNKWILPQTPQPAVLDVQRALPGARLTSRRRDERGPR
jgi:Ca2+-transporting ATPase